MNGKEQKIFLFSKTSYPDVNHIPILHIEYLQPTIDFSSYDYIIATSKEVFSALDKIGEWKELPILAISKSTQKFAKKIGAKILDVSEGYGEDLVGLIKQKYRQLKALYPHAERVAFDIESHLKALDISVDSFSVYKTSCSKTSKIELPSDAICVFTSPSAIRCFESLYAFLPTYKVVCIGKTTRSALPEKVESVLSESTSVKSAIECAKRLV